MSISGFSPQIVKWCVTFLFVCLFASSAVQARPANAQGVDLEPSPRHSTIENSMGNINVLATTPHCETISSNQTWSSSDNVHVVTCNVIVASGATLTIQAGAIIKFNLNTRLTVNGKLLVQGTGPAPVIITSYKDDEYGSDTNGDGASVCTPGDWDGIFFGDTSDDTSLVDHALIRCTGDGYYGRAGINLDNASPTVQHSEFRQDAYCGIQGDLHSFPRLIGNTYTGNAANGFCLLPQAGETIDINAAWSPIDTSYYLRGNITVVLGKTLTLSPGIVVKVGLNNRLTINGKLLAQGTGTEPVTITSYQDDEHGIGNNWDTNGNGASVCSAGDWDGIFFGNTSDDTSLVDHALVRCVGDGYYARAGINFDNASPVVQNSEFRQSAYCALHADLHSFPTLSGNTYTNNAGNGLCLLPESGETIDANTIWSPIDTSYYLRGNITVVLGKTLTLSPGIVVKAGLNNRLTINGKLLVQGTGLAPVIITSYKDDEYGMGNNRDTDGGGASVCASDDWDGIFFGDTSDDTSLVDHALIRCAGDGYYGRTGINLDNASPTVQNSEFRQNAYCAVQGDLHSFPRLIGNTYTGNAANGFCLLPQAGETIDANSTWSPIDTSYYVRGNITVVLGKTLTLSPGIVVKVALNNRLSVNGKLMIQGTEPASVIITSYKDDEYGIGNNKDTDGNGASVCASDDWDGIFFGNTSDDTSTVDYALIRCAGDGYYKFGAINLDNASPTLKNSTLTKNAIGVVANATSPVFGCNNIYGNANYGLYNKTPATIAAAENQWWGDPSGPYHPTRNPNGNGNAISDGVDFTPYRTSPCGSPTQITYTLTITKTGAGSGVVWSEPSGIQCGATCSYGFNANTNVTLHATASDLSEFTGWSGGGCSGTDPCTVSMSQAVSVNANFVLVSDRIFTDVPESYWARDFIERLYKAGITGGCATVPLRYCPEDTVTRAQMAVFLLRGIHTSAYTPPAIGATSGFADVPVDYWSGAWIKQLAAEGITAGCGNGNYCPEHPVTRAQMAVFLMRSKYGSSYIPPAVGGTTGFTDVPPDYWAAAWIKQLVIEGITSGCGSGNYCPEKSVTRAEMAVFLVRTFNLP
jgi:hypothetical protein